MTMRGHLRYFGMVATAASVIAALPSDGDTTVYKRWSDPATWGGSLPVAGDPIIIGPSDNILLDVVTPALGALTINGKFKFDPNQNVHLTADSIMVNGTAEWRIGSATAPYRQQAGITLTGQMPTVSLNAGAGPLVRGRSYQGLLPTGNNGTTNDNGGISRGIIVNPGAKIGWYGAVPADLKASLNQHANVGDTSITLDRGVTWKQGDKIVIPPTGYYSTARRAEVYTVAANTNGSATVQLTTPITFKRWGRMQYPTDNGISLSPDAYTLRTLANPSGMRPSVDTPAFIDQRATVENLTRNCMVQGGVEDGFGGDVAWRRDGFGVHMMVMGLASDVVVDGVAFDRCGQRGLLGRYPFHWHLVSYDPATGSLLGDIPTGKGIFSRNAVTNSENRGTTIHATCGAQVIGNTYWNIKGHTILLEDGSEERNTISSNGGYYLRTMDAGYEIKQHDVYDENSGGGTSLLWLSNLYNHVTNNVGADIKGVGILNSPHVDHLWMPVPVINGAGRATFYADSTRAYAEDTYQAGLALEQNHVLTCTNAAVPATFSHVGSVSGSLPNMTIGVNFNDSADAGIVASVYNVTTPFVVGDTISFNTKLLQCTGPSRLAPVLPYYREVLEWDNNRIWGASNVGIFSGQCVTNEDGNLGQNYFKSTTDGLRTNYGSTSIPSVFKRAQIHHCANGGYLNRAETPEYDSWTQSDNGLADFAGATHGGAIKDTLLCNKTLNVDVNDGTWLNDHSAEARHGMASYHGNLDFINIVAYGYEGDGSFTLGNGQHEGNGLTTGSLIESWDFYLVPVERAMASASNLCLFNTTAMMLCPPNTLIQPYFSDVTQIPNGKGSVAKSTAVWDPKGYLTGTAGAYLCSSHPAVTYGMKNKTSMPLIHNVSTTDHMVGVKALFRDWPAPLFFDGGNTRSQTFRRYDPTTLTPALKPDGSQLDDYICADYFVDGSTTDQVVAYRFIGMPAGGAVLVYPTGTAIPAMVYTTASLNELHGRIDGGDSANDTVTVGLRWTNTKTPIVKKSYNIVNADNSGLGYDQNRPSTDYVKADPNMSYQVTLTSVSSAAFLNSSVGDTYWNDTANQIVWSKVLPMPGDSYAAHTTKDQSEMFLTINDGSKG